MQSLSLQLPASGGRWTHHQQRESLKEEWSSLGPGIQVRTVCTLGLQLDDPGIVLRIDVDTDRIGKKEQRRAMVTL